MNIYKKLLAATSLVVLSGCTLVPGSHVSGPYSETVDLSEPELEQVEIQMITPALIRTHALDQVHSVLNPQLDADIAAYDYVVGKGDVLNVTVWDHPELTIPAGSFRSAQDAGNWVHNDGTIFYPYVGKVSVAGLTVTEIREILSQRLEKYIEKPQVDVSVAAFRSQRVYMTGEVNTPGQLPVTNVPLTLLDALNLSQGLAEHADWENVTLTRNGEARLLSLRNLYENGDISQNMLLKHNDVVHVPRNDGMRVFVMGEVADATAVTFNRNGMTLAEALTEAGGINEGQADANGIFVLRLNREDDGRLADIYQLHAKDASAFILADQFVLEPRDVVYVTAAPVARWNRIIQQLLPTVQGLYWLGRSYDDLDI
ncbi:polysaccharide export protein [Ferrimonas pelagia]|uniref:Polysaccharide export protein n=1 Tax=Ferrimonas pelagia TaxID=1177826 RepID=A0ABP9ECC7_9GAMM